MVWTRPSLKGEPSPALIPSWPNLMSRLAKADHHLERHALFVQCNHLIREFHSGAVLLSNQTPKIFWSQIIQRALKISVGLVGNLIARCGEHDFEGWMFEFRLPAKVCLKFNVRPGSIDQVVLFWKILSAVHLLKIWSALLGESFTSPTPTSPPSWTDVDLSEVASIMSKRDEWKKILGHASIFVQSPLGEIVEKG